MKHPEACVILKNFNAYCQKVYILRTKNCMQQVLIHMTQTYDVSSFTRNVSWFYFTSTIFSTLRYADKMRAVLLLIMTSDGNRCKFTWQWRYCVPKYLSSSTAFGPTGWHIKECISQSAKAIRVKLIGYIHILIFITRPVWNCYECSFNSNEIKTRSHEQLCYESPHFTSERHPYQIVTLLLPTQVLSVSP